MRRPVKVWFARVPTSSNISDGPSRFDLTEMEKFGISQRKVHWKNLLERMGNEGSSSWGFKTGSWEFSHRAFQKGMPACAQWTFGNAILILWWVWMFSTCQWCQLSDCNLTATAFFDFDVSYHARGLYITPFLYMSVEKGFGFPSLKDVTE